MAMDGGKTIVNIIEDNENGRDWWQQKRKLCNWQRLVATKKLILQMATNGGNKKKIIQMAEIGSTNKDDFANGSE